MRNRREIEKGGVDPGLEEEADGTVRRPVPFAFEQLDDHLTVKRRIDLLDGVNLGFPKWLELLETRISGQLRRQIDRMGLTSVSNISSSERDRSRDSISFPLPLA